MEKIIDYVENEIVQKIDTEIHTDWRLGFLAAYNYQRILLSNQKPLHEIQKIDPWTLQNFVEALYERLMESSHIELTDVDELMEDFVASWLKPKHLSPLEDAFKRAKKELDYQNRDSIKARSEADDALIKRICEIMSKENEAFFIPTRKLGGLLNKNRNYIAGKLRKLVNENFLIMVKKGSQYNSPHFKMNQKKDDAEGISNF